MSTALIDERWEDCTVVELRRECGRLGIGASGWRATARQDALILALRTGKGPETASAPVAAPAGGGLDAMLALAIEPHLKNRTIDRTEFDALAESWVEQSETVAALTKEVADLREKLDAGEFTAKGGGAALTVSFASPVKVGTVDGLAHRQLPQVITWTACDAPLWLWGGAGCGKTHMARQVAAALGLPVYVISIDPTMTVGKLLGFRSLAGGEFVPGFLLAPYRDGGVVMLDEIDTGDAGILAALNALLANGHYTFPDGEEVTRHPNFRVIAGANTKGTGPVAGYTARTRLDAATLNRFAVVELTVDEGLELAMVCGGENTSTPWKKADMLNPEACAAACKRWVQWVQKARAACPSVLISPRASLLGAKAIRAGIPIAEVAEALVFALCSVDARRNILTAAGSF